MASCREYSLSHSMFKILVDEQQAAQPNYQSTSPTHSPGGDPHNDTTTTVKQSEERSPLQSVVSFVMQQSYVGALIVMMVSCMGSTCAFIIITVC